MRQQDRNKLAPVQLFGDIPALLIALRKRNGLSRKAAAAASGISERALTKYEKRESVPGVVAFEKVLVAYGITDLMRLQEEVDALRTGKRVARGVTIRTDSDDSEEIIRGLGRAIAKLTERREDSSRLQSEQTVPGEGEPTENGGPHAVGGRGGERSKSRK